MQNRTENETVSVIIPVYNTEQYLDRCISSVINQTYNNLEIIIVNDCSSDKSPSICKSWKEKDKRIIFINKEHNTGASDSRNIALDIAKGKYIAFVDSDDFVDKDLIKEMVDSIEKNESDMSMCEANFFSDTDSKMISNHYLSAMDKATFLRNIIKLNNCNTLWAKLLIKEIIGEIRFNKDVCLGEDAAFLCKYVDRISKISYVNKNLYNYNINNQNSIIHGDSKIFITGIKSNYEINKILEKNNIEDRFYVQADSVCNLTIYKARIGKNFDYGEYDKIVKEYIDDGLIRKVGGIKNKVKVFMAYYVKGIYLLFNKIKKYFR